MNNYITVNILQAKSLVQKVLKGGCVPMLHGSPGNAKSAILAEIAEEKNLELIDIRLAQCDPTDLNGFPSITNGVASYIPMDMFPLKGATIPKDKNGWLIIFDEISSASPAVQSASYKIILDRKVGNYALHDNCFMVAAGNLATDNAVVEEMSTALQSRLVHFQVAPDMQAWFNWAGKEGIDHRILAFLNYQGSSFNNFDPDHSDFTFACPRTWHMLSSITKGSPVDHELLPLVAGTIGTGAAHDYVSFCAVYENLPSHEEMLLNPTSFSISDDPAIKWAAAMLLATEMDKDNAKDSLEALTYLGIEYAHVATSLCLKRLGSVLMTIPAARKWVIEYTRKYHL